MGIRQIRAAIREHADETQAKNLQWFFKTGPGEYGEGDKFLGLKVPVIRKIANANTDLTFSELQKLLDSKYHEDRLAALLILVKIFPKSGDEEKEKIFNFYLKNTANINNWDLVDLSAPKITGEYLLTRNKDIIFGLAASDNLWERRIAVLTTFRFIKENQYNTSLDICLKLLNDPHDLIHKAVGWMLREIGKRDLKAEEDFLKIHYKQMPRTMLRYAIEKFPEKKRLAYLKGNI